MDPELGDDLIASITSDVLECLRRAKFFEELDNLLCPTDASTERRQCSGNYTLSEQILNSSGFNASDQNDIFEVLRSLGGFCDCEILYNAAETSRLKAEHWQRQARGGTSPAQHTNS